MAEGPAARNVPPGRGAGRDVSRCGCFLGNAVLRAARFYISALAPPAMRPMQIMIRAVKK